MNAGGAYFLSQFLRSPHIFAQQEELVYGFARRASTLSDKKTAHRTASIIARSHSPSSGQV
jgi:hypothetical protein